MAEINRAPRGTPDRFAVVNIEVSSSHISRYVVIAIAGDAAKSCILIEAISACGVGNKGEEPFCAKVVYPRVGGLRLSDDIFTVLVVEISELHILKSSFQTKSLQFDYTLKENFCKLFSHKIIKLGKE